MNFISATYVIFLFTTYIAYWKSGSRKRQNLILAVCSYVFYGWWDPRFCILMLASTCVDYFCAIGIDSSNSQARRRTILAFSLVSNLGLLAFFKYFNFFQDSFLFATRSVGLEIDPFTASIILPVGISFYTFQTLSYSIDVFRRDLKPTRSFIDYVVYVSFFPQLVAGPIERGASMMPQILQPRVFRSENVVCGLEQIVWGFFKKVGVASNLSPIVDSILGDVANHSGPEIWLAAFCFGIQIYCDFSGYSDIAIGSARMFGINLMRNFAFPYFSQSLREFWRRWHISLSTWFRDYLYIPLGGNKNSPLRNNFTLLLVFVLSGLWHGASWNFVIWGAIHGVFLIVENRFLNKPQLKSTDVACGPGFLPSPLKFARMFYVWIIVLIAWVFFRIPGFDDSILAVTKMAFDWRMPEFEGMNRTVLLFYCCFIPGILFFTEWISRKHEVPFFPLNQGWPPLAYVACTCCLWATFWLKPADVSQFIYFQF